MRRPNRGLGTALARLFAVGLALASGCASDLVASDGGYRNRRLGYSIAVPGGSGAPWKRFDVKGAVLAFRRDGGDTMSMQSHCGRPVATPAIMARELVIGVRNRTLRQAGPVSVGDLSGWTQTFDAPQGSGSVRVKTVTVVARDCIFDWTLVAARDFDACEPDFDAWWRSFHLDDAGVAGGAAP